MVEEHRKNVSASAVKYDEILQRINTSKPLFHPVLQFRAAGSEWWLRCTVLVWWIGLDDQDVVHERCNGGVLGVSNNRMDSCIVAAGLY